ncbi:barstar family protein [Pseudomonas palleroniana]|uniref:barstar family protein n=1 Tax=Pseudomonas palleroniana TaxID=191390 RepID=UPI00398FE6F1
MNVVILGKKIMSEMDFHQQLATALDVQGFYGFNRDALWDLLSAGVERPVVLVWKSAQVSKMNLGASFEEIVEVLERVKQQDEGFGWEDKFTYELD